MMKRTFLQLFLLVFITTVSIAQNSNTPNKIGPMGVQVNTFSGNLFIPRNDLIIPSRGFRIDVSFFYNSFNYDTNVGFGNGWNFLYHVAYRNDTGGRKTIVWGDGREDTYLPLGSNTFKSPTGIYNTLTQIQPDKLLLKELDGTTYFFNDSVHKLLSRMEEPSGNFLQFNYTDSLLASVINSAGQTISFTYDSKGRLTNIADAIVSPSRSYTFDYDAAGNLTKVTDPLGGTNKYTYLVNGPMKTITDKNNNTVNIIYYHDLNVRELVGCNRRVSFSYDEVSLTSYVTDHLANGSNQITQYEYKQIEDRTLLIRKSVNAGNYSVAFDYDSNANLVKQTDANGNTTAFTYDANGNVVSITDALGQRTFYAFGTSFNKMIAATDANGVIRTMEYDSKGNLLKFKEPLGLTTSFSYSSNGDLTSVTDPKGNVINIAYDTYGNPSTITGALGFSMSYQYDARGRLLSLTDPRGFVYTMQYDALDRLLSGTDPLGHTILRTYDAEGNVVSATNENGQKDLFFYDASNRLVRAVNAKGYQTNLGYDAMGNLTNVTDALGNKASMTYDNLNHLQAMRDALGQTTSYSYDGNGNLVKATTPTGRSLSYNYDKLNRLVKSEDNLGMLGSFTYDANGNITTVTNGIGAITTFTYDALNRLIKTTDALGYATTATYDNNGNLVSVTDRNNKSVNYQYDARNRLLTETNKNGFATNYTYDAGDNLSSIRDANNNTTLYTYDNLNRLSKLTYPDGSFLQLTYDNLRNIVAKRTTAGDVISYQYDSLNRMIGKVLPGNNAFNYSYDPLGRLLTAANSSSSVSLAYDAIGRLTSETLHGKTIRYNYNTVANLQTIVYSDSSQVARQFNSRGKLINIRKNNQNVASYSYNNSNQLVGYVLGNNIQSSRQYDFATRLSLVNTGSLQNMHYAVEKEWNKTAVVRNNQPAETEEYSYDNGYRLTQYKKSSASVPAMQEQSYNYDPIGNRNAFTSGGSTTTYTANNLNQLTAIAAPGQTINYTYDANGNLTFDGSFHKTYDAEGRILTDSASPSLHLSYRYDALGRRIEKVVNDRPLKYIYSGLAQIEQRDGITDTLINKYVFGGFTAPVMFESGNQTYYCLPNHLNSVEAVVNSNGNLVEKYAYDPFGKSTIYDAANNVIPAAVSGNRFGFTGQEFDAETGKYHFPYRQYSPTTGTFLQRDPIGYRGGLALYQYTGNNPVNYVDILGARPGGLTQLNDNMHGNGDVSGNHAGGSNGHAPESWSHWGGNNAKNTLSGLGFVEDFVIQTKDKTMVTLREIQKSSVTAQRRKNFLDNPWVQRLNAGLKAYFLYEKIHKTIESWNKDCPTDKIINVTEIGISSYSLVMTLNKIGWLGKTAWKQIPILKAYGILDAISKLTTGKSILQNTKSLSNWHGDMMDKHPYLDKAEAWMPGTGWAGARGLGYLDGRYNISNNVMEAGSNLVNGAMSMGSDFLNGIMETGSAIQNNVGGALMQPMYGYY